MYFLSFNFNACDAAAAENHRNTEVSRTEVADNIFVFSELEVLVCKVQQKIFKIPEALFCVCVLSIR